MGGREGGREGEREGEREGDREQLKASTIKCLTTNQSSLETGNHTTLECSHLSPPLPLPLPPSHTVT